MSHATRDRGLELVASCIAILAVAGCGSAEEKTAAGTGSLAVVGAQPGGAVASETKTFRDWFAVCDNGNDCWAFGPAAEGGTGWIGVRMAAGPDARPEVATGFWGETQDGGAIRITVDGRALPTKRVPDDDGAILADPRAAIAALASGRSMTLARDGETQAMNLSGASAALLWIDERQGRLDTVAALIRKGDRPASEVPAAPALPLVIAAPAVAQANLPADPPAALAGRSDVAACRNAWNPATFEEGLSRARLDATTELWGVACGAGAYNFMTRWFLTGPNGSDPRPLLLRGTSREEQDELVNSEYDPTTRTLSQFSKGRGIGDCGVAATWTWTGRAFVLTEESVMGQCWGVGADRWPTTWRSRAR